MNNTMVYKEKEFRHLNEQEVHKKCSYCEAYDRCNGDPCPYILDLEMVGARNYENFLKDYLSEVKNVEFRKKMLSTASFFDGTWFQSE